MKKNLFKKKLLVSVIIANYNGEKYLNDCLGSLMKSKYQNLEVIIVDDGSKDSSEKILKTYAEKYKKIRIFPNDRNIGLSKSRNRAIKECKGEVLLFLDNDTEIKDTTIGELVRTLYSSSDLGAVQALLIDFEKRDLVQVGGLKLIPYTGWGIILGQWEKRVKYNASNSKNVIGLGAALAVKKEAVMKVDGFDEELFHYTDDLDFSYRIWLAGYKIAIVPNAIVYHWTKPMEMRKNVHDNNEKVYFHMGKNSIRFILKNYEFINILKYLPICIGILSVRAILVLLRRNDVSCLKGTVKSFFWNILKIKSTLKNRYAIQRYREVSDKFAFDAVMINNSPLAIYRKHFKWAKLL